MTPNEWIAKYNDKVKEPLDPLPDDWIFADEEKGFLILRPQRNGVLWLYATCGDGQYWSDFAVAKAKEFGFKYVRAATPHPERLWEKRGWRFHSYLIEREVT